MVGFKCDVETSLAVGVEQRKRLWQHQCKDRWKQTTVLARKVCDRIFIFI
jgi:hypothetical protein